MAAARELSRPKRLNTRLRSSVLERKAKNDAFVEREKFDELQKENQLLALKFVLKISYDPIALNGFQLKTVKHQILTYTTPSARPATASVMTITSPISPIWDASNDLILTASSEILTKLSSSIDNIQDPGERVKSTPLKRISENTLRDKAGYIRLNRLVREKSSQIAEMQYEIDRLNRLLADLRSQLEQKSSIVRKLEVELRNARETTENVQYLSKVELITKQLAVIEAENEVLKEANERLVKQSLSIEFDESTKEQIELKKQISLLEEKIKDSEHRRLQVEQILRAEKKKHKNDNDILQRLYQDVAAILESHDIQHDKTDFDTSIDSAEQIARWKKMYAALYDELEKLRNMLLIQHDINQKQCTEIKLLQEGMECSKKKYESKLKEMRDNMMEKQKRILLLEEQIRSIAYGKQEWTTAAAPAEKKEEFSTDLSITLTEIRLADEFIAAIGTCPAYFLSLEFFDFELQTTPILTKPTATLDFTTIYNNGITIELYSPRSSSYILLAAAVVNLKPLLQKKAKSRVVGELKMISVDSGSTVANLKYELNATDELERCITSYQVQEEYNSNDFKAAEAALKVLPIEIPQHGDDFEEMTVIVNRCTGLDNLKQGEMEVCVIYEFFSFSPYFTNTVTSSKTAEFNSKREWSVPVEALHSYLTETEITFFLFENRPENIEERDGVLAMLSLPLAPLVENKPIKGTFEMIKADGSDCGVFLDVNVMWKHGLIRPVSKPHLLESAILQKEVVPLDGYLPTPTPGCEKGKANALVDVVDSTLAPATGDLAHVWESLWLYFTSCVDMKREWTK
uniref:C2-C2_1 domain-containing protein n=1 Tax=Angiostrongylus cantonensis TaxID=6313 RepID=A0A158P7U1_ANGCA